MYLLVIKLINHSINKSFFKSLCDNFHEEIYFEKNEKLEIFLSNNIFLNE